MQTTLDALCVQMRDTESAFQKIDLMLEAIRFETFPPASVAATAKHTFSAVDLPLAVFRGNPMRAPLANQLKIQYLKDIELKVAGSQRASRGDANSLSRARSTLRWKSKPFDNYLPMQ